MITFTSDAARLWSVVFSALLLVAAAAPYFARVAGVGYLAAAIVLSGLFLAFAIDGVVKKGGSKWARQYFLSSLVYLVGLFVALGVDAR